MALKSLWTFSLVIVSYVAWTDIKASSSESAAPISDGVTWDSDVAIKTRAEQGDAEAQFNLGSMYITGKGEPQNSQEGVKWVRKAADQGFATAQYSLGYMYAAGEIVKQDYRQSVIWLFIRFKMRCRTTNPSKLSLGSFTFAKVITTRKRSVTAC